MQKIDEVLRRTARSRTPTACLQCQKRKQRCSREQPCRHCSRRYPPVECIYTSEGRHSSRPAPSPSRLSVPEPSYYTDMNLQNTQSATPSVSQGFSSTKQVYSYGQEPEQIESGATFGNTTLAPVIELTPFPSQPQYYQATRSNQSSPNTGAFNTVAIEPNGFDGSQSSCLPSESSNQALSYDFMGARDLETSTWDSNTTSAISHMPTFDDFAPINGNPRVFAFSGPSTFESTPVVGSYDTTTTSFVGSTFTAPYTRTDNIPQQIPTTASGYSEQSRTYYYDQ
ncbi:hypothetical protein ACMFMG_005057 [Clarireedia jacksonii]